MNTPGKLPDFITGHRPTIFFERNRSCEIRTLTRLVILLQFSSTLA